MSFTVYTYVLYCTVATALCFKKLVFNWQCHEILWQFCSCIESIWASDKQVKMVYLKDMFSRRYSRNKWLRAELTSSRLILRGVNLFFKWVSVKNMLIFRKSCGNPKLANTAWTVESTHNIFWKLFNGLAFQKIRISLRIRVFKRNHLNLFIRGSDGLD